MKLKKKRKKIKKNKQQQSYQFSAESGERYDEWLEEAGKRWSKMEDSPEKVLRILTEMLLASANFSSWDISSRLALNVDLSFQLFSFRWKKESHSPA